MHVKSSDDSVTVLNSARVNKIRHLTIDKDYINSHVIEIRNYSVILPLAITQPLVKPGAKKNPIKYNTIFSYVYVYKCITKLCI